MSLKIFISNFWRSVIGTFSQFESDDSLISEEMQDILSDAAARKELFEKIEEARNGGDQNIKFTYNKKSIEYLVEQ